MVVLRRLGLTLLVTGVVTVVLAPLVLSGALGGLRQQLNDLQYPTGPVDDRLTVVELPLDATGWTRAQHAELVAALADDAPLAVGYDIVLDAGRAGDDQLTAALADAGVVVLAASAQLSGEVRAGMPQAIAVTRPTDQLAAAAAGTGNANVLVSRVDATVREVPLVVEDTDGRVLPALSLATVMVAEGSDPGAVTLQAGNGVVVGSEVVPTDPQRALEINWAVEPDMLVVGEQEGAVTKVDVDSVLAGEVSLAGRIVLVGVVDPLGDVFPTPLDRATTPGVYVQANAINTLLTDQYRSGPDHGVTLAVVAALAAIVALVGMFVRLGLVGVLALGLLVAWQAVVNWQFQLGRNLDNLWPNVAVLLAAGAVVGVRYLTEVRERRRVAGQFRHHVPDHVAEDPAATDQLVAAAAGQRQLVTVLLCHVRGFTATAATLPPADLRALLEVYHDVATGILHEHDGTVVHLVGDEVFAVFGAPLPMEDHAERALAAARALQDAAGEINAQLAERGIEIAYGIGLNTGEVTAAHVGGQARGHYAVVGDTVEVGARLCSLAAPGGIVLSRSVRDELDDVPPVELLDERALEGVEGDPEPARLRD